MKRVVLLLIILLALAGEGFCQQTFTMGNKTARNQALGALWADSVLRAPNVKKIYGYWDGTGNLAVVSDTFWYYSSGSWHYVVGDGGGGGGTVTSVGLSTNASYLTVGSSPVTSSGTITINKTTGLTANQFVATPNGSIGTAELRAIVAADLPNTAVSAGSYGSSTSIPSFTVDAQGRLTSASGNVVIAPAGTLTGTTLASNVITSSLTTIGTITSGGLGTGAVIGGATVTVGSDATGDIYYRNSGGVFTRLAVGASTTVLLGGTTPSYGQVTGSHIASSVALAGSPTTTTQAIDENSTKIATTAYVQLYIPLDTTISAAYTLTSRDAYRTIHCTNGSNIALTVPTGLGTRFVCTVIQEAAGTVTPTTSSTTFYMIPTGTTKTKQQGSQMVIRSTATANTFSVQGDMQ